MHVRRRLAQPPGKISLCQASVVPPLPQQPAKSCSTSYRRKKKRPFRGVGPAMLSPGGLIDIVPFLTASADQMPLGFFFAQTPGLLPALQRGFDLLLKARAEILVLALRLEQRFGLSLLAGYKIELFLRALIQSQQSGVT